MQILPSFLVSLLLSLLCVSSVSGHAYFSWPPPRQAWCTDPLTCSTENGGSPQGPIWVFNGTSEINNDPILAKTCGTQQSVYGGGSGPADTPKPLATMIAGQTYALNIFVSQVHPNYPASPFPTDGWVIRGRDLGNDPTGTFGVQNGFSYSVSQGVDFHNNLLGSNWNNSVPNSLGLWPTQSFVVGSTLQVFITAPTTPTTDYVFQFYWANSAVQPPGTFGVAWLSCADVIIVKNAAGGLSSADSRMIAPAFAALAVFITMMMTKFQ